MRVVLVGSESDRAALKAQLPDDVVIVGEVPNLAAARTAGLDADGWLVAPHESRERKEAFAEALTSRELEVLELLVHGLANKAIAGRLRISDQTVKFHVASICGKLGAANRTDAVRLALRRGLIAL